MTQMKRTPKKMRRRMKGGADDEGSVERRIEENEKILEEKVAALQAKEKYAADKKDLLTEKVQEQESVSESLEEEERIQKEKEKKQEKDQKDAVDKARKEAEKAASSADQEGKVVKRILGGPPPEYPPPRGPSELEAIKEARDKKRLPLEEAKGVIKDAEGLQGDIICRMKVPEIKEDLQFSVMDKAGQAERREWRGPGQLGGGEAEDVINQVKRFIEYKLITNINYSEGGSEEGSEEGSGEGVVQTQTGGVIPEVSGIFSKVTTAIKSSDEAKKKKEKEEKDKISGLKKLSDITFNILKGNKEKKDKQNLDITLLYFYYIQQVMEYIKDDFNNMQALITNVKNNKQLQIEGESRSEFIKTYKFIFGGSFNKEVGEEVKIFNGASYYTFNSTRLSKPEDRKKYLDINDNEKDLPEKRQRLLEFISYIYITRKKDMENYLYYIEKIGELTEEYSDSKSSETEAEGEEEGGEGEEEESRAADALTAADAPTATESTVAESTVEDEPAAVEAAQEGPEPEAGSAGGGQYNRRRRTPVKRRR